MAKNHLVAVKHILVSVKHHLGEAYHHLITSTHHLGEAHQDDVSSKPINGMPQQVFEFMKLVFVLEKGVDEIGRSDFGKEFRVFDKAKHMLHSHNIQ